MIYRSVEILGLLALAGFAAAPAQAQKLVEGLTLAQFKKAFIQSADWDKEQDVRLKDCKEKTLPGKPGRSFSCLVSEAGFVSGLSAGDSMLRDATVTFIASDRSAVADFQRASKYLIYATQAERTNGAVSLVAELMGNALKMPSKPSVKSIGGVRYSAMFDTATSSAPHWRFTAELP